MWDVEAEQDLFFGGQEKGPNKEQGEHSRIDPVGKEGGDKGWKNSNRSRTKWGKRDEKGRGRV